VPQLDTSSLYAARVASREELARSFGDAASVYEAGRPEYPVEAVEWMLAPVPDPGRPLRVADVGAGTGKLSRRVAGLGADVVAVDPDAAMLAELRRRVPDVEVHVGTAERLPLPDASRDAVVLGQAWHWVDQAPASREVARVLSPGGVLGLVWNLRDVAVPWVARLSELAGVSTSEAMFANGGPAVSAPFVTIEERAWRWETSVTRAGLFNLIRSRSHVITASDGERARIEAALGALCDEIGAVGAEAVTLPYVTVAFRAVRP
jgi:SAM-dependent methyltransferase